MLFGAAHKCVSEGMNPGFIAICYMTLIIPHHQPFRAFSRIPTFQAWLTSRPGAGVFVPDPLLIHC